MAKFRLVHGDCVPVLAGLPRQRVAIISDPPYGINLQTDYKANKRGKLAQSNDFAINRLTRLTCSALKLWFCLVLIISLRSCQIQQAGLFELWVLRYYGLLDNPPAPFAERLMNIIEEKFNRHLYNNKIEGYGFVLYPKK